MADSEMSESCRSGDMERESGLTDVKRGTAHASVAKVAGHHKLQDCKKRL